MPLDPFLEPLVAQMPPFPERIDDFAAFRAQELATLDSYADQLVEWPEFSGTKRTETIPVDGGEITLNVFHPGTEGTLPVHIYIHGGGWIGGSIHTRVIDVVCQERAAGADCVVVAVEYRKAPEHQFPTGLEDVHAALLWIVEHADDLGVSIDALTIGGGSAGANLAAALTLKVRDEGGPAIAFQVLEVPALDMTLQSPSIKRNGSGYGLDRHTIETLLPLYLPRSSDATNPLASPLLADDLTALPEAYIVVSEYDPLADDGERYADRLRQAGVPVTFVVGHGHIHGSSAYTKVMASARQWRDDVVAALRDANARALHH